MTRDRAILLTFVGLGVFLLGWLAKDWIYGLLPYLSPVKPFVDEGGLRATGALIALAGAYFWVKARAV